MSSHLLADHLAGLAARRSALVLVTGAVGAGKSSACQQAAEILQRRGMRIGGVIALRASAEPAPGGREPAGEAPGRQPAEAASGNAPLAGQAQRAGAAGQTIGYDVIELSSGQRRPLARRASGAAIARIGCFDMLPGGLALARQALERSATRARFVFVDEVGPWELQGSGLAAPLRRLLRRPLILSLVVRSPLVERVMRAFALRAPRLWRIPGA